MSRMRQITTHHSDHESNLDALLEDLQTTVSRSNSQLNLNGSVTTGFREVRRTMTDGTPEGTVSDYQIQYVNPANASHHIVESSNSYNTASPSQRQMYKATTYNYNSNDHHSEKNDSKLKQNISELDSLLDDLNTAQKRGFSSESTVVSRHTGGIDPGLLEPLTSSTPGGGRLLEEKHYREERVVRGRSTSPTTRRELVFTGPRSREPSPITPVRQQQFYRYEKTTTTKNTGPVMTDITPDSSQVLRSNNYAIEDSAYRNRSPSPGANRIEYHYSNNSTLNNRDTSSHYPIDKAPRNDQHDSREYTNQRYTSGKTANSYSYSSSSTTRESRSEVPKSPPPHRSPSPVSFNPPPAPKSKGPYSYDPPPPPRSPQPLRFSPSSPKTTQSTYKYSSTTTTNNYNNYHNSQQYPEEQPLLPRPFPSPSPTPNPGEQQPPKKLDELMATFSDMEIRNRRNEAYSSHHRYDQRDVRETEKVNHSLIPNGHSKEKIVEKEKIIEKEKEKPIVKREESKNVEGPPVYYPPGVELFSKKEEMAAQQQSGGGMYKAKAKYEYESKSKSKSKESSGKAVVPVCLPVCCAMPCTII